MTVLPQQKLNIFRAILLLNSFFVYQITCAQHIINLYEGAAPGSENWNWKEGKTDKTPIKTTVLYNVTTPTLTLFKPDASVANGSAVIILPGGGGRVLLFEKEGVTTAQQLVKSGITVFVLKYRLAPSFTDDPWKEMMLHLRDTTRRRDTVSAIGLMARNDLQQAIRHVKQNASVYGIDPNRIGLIGFSNGAGMILSLLTSEAAWKPNFAAVNYGVRRQPLQVPQGEKIPLFIAAATDDQLALASNSINIYNDWVTAGQSAELHLYAKGGLNLPGAPTHGLNGKPANTWVARFLDWMEAMSFLR